MSAVLTPACEAGKGDGFKPPSVVCAAAPGAAADPPPPNPPPRPPASSTLAFATTVAQETWGAFYRSFSPYEWDAPTDDEDYCKWMADVLVCDYIKNADDCEWKDSDAGGEKEVLTPCEWYEGKCELRDYLQIGARGSFVTRFVTSSRRANPRTTRAPPSVATKKTKTLMKNAWIPARVPPSVDAAMAAADAASSEITNHRGSAHGVPPVHARRRRVQRIGQRRYRRSSTKPNSNAPNATDALGTRLRAAGRPVRAHACVARGDVARGLHSANAARAAPRAAAAARLRVRVRSHEGRRPRRSFPVDGLDVHGRLQRHLAVVDVRMYPGV